MKVLFSKLTDRLRAFGTGGLQNLALGAGAAFVSHGVGRIYAPAGEILAGLFVLAAGVLLALRTPA